MAREKKAKAENGALRPLCPTVAQAIEGCSRLERLEALARRLTQPHRHRCSRPFVVQRFSRVIDAIVDSHDACVAMPLALRAHEAQADVRCPLAREAALKIIFLAPRAFSSCSHKSFTAVARAMTSFDGSNNAYARGFALLNDLRLLWERRKDPAGFFGAALEALRLAREDAFLFDSLAPALIKTARSGLAEGASEEDKRFFLDGIEEARGLTRRDSTLYTLFDQMVQAHAPEEERTPWRERSAPPVPPPAARAAGAPPRLGPHAAPAWG